MGASQPNPAVLTVVTGRQLYLSMTAVCCYRTGCRPRMLEHPPQWYHDTELIPLLDQAHQQLGAPLILIF